MATTPIPSKRVDAVVGHLLRAHDVPPDPLFPPAPTPPPTGSEPEVRDPPAPDQTPPVGEPPKHS